MAGCYHSLVAVHLHHCDAQRRRVTNMGLCGHGRPKGSKMLQLHDRGSTVSTPMHPSKTSMCLHLIHSCLITVLSAARIGCCCSLVWFLGFVPCNHGIFELLKPKLLQCPDCDTAFELLRTVIHNFHQFLHHSYKRVNCTFAHRLLLGCGIRLH